MRQAPTAVEAVLWEALRDRRVDGLKFRRQFGVGRFILDFCCVENRLAIELDGSAHDTLVERDEERTAVLEAAGFRVLRFRNEEVQRDAGAVIDQIFRAARESAH